MKDTIAYYLKNGEDHRDFINKIRFPRKDLVTFNPIGIYFDTDSNEVGLFEKNSPVDRRAHRVGSIEEFIALYVAYRTLG